MSELPSVVNRSSPKYREAMASLPAALRPVYEELVADYASFTFQEYGRGYVAYRVLAHLVRAGWRPSGRRESAKPA